VGAVSLTSTRQIHAFALICPGEVIITLQFQKVLNKQDLDKNNEKTHSIVELLIGIVGGAGPDLQLCAVSGATASDVQALITKNLDTTTVECPFLGICASASLDGNGGSVAIKSGG
jgi:hypothetical protein